MRFFSTNRDFGGWMAIALQPEGVCLAHVERTSQGRYALERVAFYPGDNSPDAASLEKVSKELRADRYRWTNLLSLNEYQLLSVDAPNVPPDELKTAIRWRLKDMLDYHIDDATIDVLEVPAEKSARARTNAMYAVAAHNQVIERRQTLFGDAKLPISVIDIPEMAQRNVAALVEPEGRGLAMLSLQPECALLTITFAAELYLSRRIDVSLSQLDEADEDQKNNCYERIVQEVQRSLDHFDRQYHFVTMSKLVLTPLGDAAPDLLAHLSENFELPVEMLDLESVLNIAKVPELKTPQMQQRYFMAIGAAMRHEVKAL
jgi:MSHA biogenesis protein MshI